MLIRKEDEDISAIRKEDEDISALPFPLLCEKLLPFRREGYIESLIDKLREEGIGAPKDLLLVSQDALETKLSQRSAFSFIELADIISFRIAAKGGPEASYRKKHSRKFCQKSKEVSFWRSTRMART